MRKIFLLSLFIFTISCKEGEKQLTADEIVNKAIENAGGEKYENAEIQFKFRDIVYKSVQQDGKYVLQRTLADTLNTTDILTNEGFTRTQKGEKTFLPDSLATLYTESVNSVHYFVQLPYRLNDPAVNKELLGETQIKDKNYYKIKVTFNPEGGGVDFEDEFIYWIHKENFTVDYLAYKFYTDEGGIRFRETYNPRRIEGIRFVDYINYKPENKDVKLEEVDRLFEQGKLQEISRIDTESIKVRILK